MRLLLGPSFFTFLLSSSNQTTCTWLLTKVVLRGQKQDANQMVKSSALPHLLAKQLSFERYDWTSAYWHFRGHSVCRLVPPTARFHFLNTRRDSFNSSCLLNLWRITFESWVLLCQQSEKSRGAAANPGNTQGNPSAGNADQIFPKTARRPTITSTPKENETER